MTSPGRASPALLFPRSFPKSSVCAITLLSCVVVSWPDSSRGRASTRKTSCSWQQVSRKESPPMPAKVLLKDRISNFNIEKYGPFVALTVLLLIMLVLQPGFFKINNVVNVLKQVSYMGCIAVGMTFVIITGGIDLSVGSMAAMTGGLMLVTTNHFKGSVPSIILALIAGCALAVGCGWAVGTLTTKGRIAPFIVTLGTGAIYRSIVLQAANGGEFRGATETYPVIGQGSFLGIPYAIFVFLAFAIVCHIILNNTRLGRYMYAVLYTSDAADEEDSVDLG